MADLLSVGSLFTTQAERNEAQRETVRDLPLQEISDFPSHPFKVRMDASMMEMVDSVKQYGVLVPALVRQRVRLYRKRHHSKIRRLRERRPVVQRPWSMGR